MPMYTFQCRTCNKKETQIRSINDYSEPLCSDCCYNPDAQGKFERMEKIINGTGGFELKGTGWFKDGY
jgi:predicted nucleic acid-binding Zn ribbon protein